MVGLVDGISIVHRAHPLSVAHCQSEPSGRREGGKGNTKRPFPVPSPFTPSLPAKRPYISPAPNNLCLRASEQGKLTRKGPLVTEALSVVTSSRCRKTDSLTHLVEQNVGVQGLQLEAGVAARTERCSLKKAASAKVMGRVK